MWAKNDFKWTGWEGSQCRSQGFLSQWFRKGECLRAVIKKQNQAKK